MTYPKSAPSALWGSREDDDWGTSPFEYLEQRGNPLQRRFIFIFKIKNTKTKTTKNISTWWDLVPTSPGNEIDQGKLERKNIKTQNLTVYPAKGTYCNYQLRFLFYDLYNNLPAAISMKIFIVRKIKLNYDK